MGREREFDESRLLSNRFARVCLAARVCLDARVSTSSRTLTLLAAIPIAVGLAGCGPVDTGSESASRPSDFGFQKSVLATLIDEGRIAYDVYCVGCHGESGDGNGAAAGFLSPRPRNFQLANFKFSSTRSGQLPTDEDLKRAITQGLKGSAMPGWDLLPPRTVGALVFYIKTFSEKWEQRQPAAPVPFVTDPYRSSADKTEAIRRGETVYHGLATCWTCHPSYVSTDEINEHLIAMENPTRDAFRDGLFESEAKPNAEGEIIYPPDFRRDFVRTSPKIDALYRSIAAGITGTAMPTWIDSMEIPRSDGQGSLVQRSDIWALAYYVHSLIKQRPAKLAEADITIRHRPQTLYLHGELPPPVPLEAPDAQDEFLDEEFDDEFEDE